MESVALRCILMLDVAVNGGRCEALNPSPHLWFYLAPDEIPSSYQDDGSEYIFKGKVSGRLSKMITPALANRRPSHLNEWDRALLLTRLKLPETTVEMAHLPLDSLFPGFGLSLMLDHNKEREGTILFWPPVFNFGHTLSRPAIDVSSNVSMGLAKTIPLTKDEEGAANDDQSLFFAP